MSLFLLVAVMAAAVAGGVASERRWQQGAERRTRSAMSLMLTWVLPPVYFVLVSRIHPDLRLVSGLLTAYVVIAIVGVIAWWIADRVMKLPRPTVGAVILAVILANTGYFGLPLTRVVLGPDELGAAVAWDSLVSGPMFFLVGFAVGAAFAPPGLLGAGGSGPPERRLVAFLKNPLLWSAIAGLAIPVDAPAWSAEIAQWVVYALLPVGFVVVGVQLSAERRIQRAQAAADAATSADGVTGPAARGPGGDLADGATRRTWRRIIAPEVALAVGLRLIIAPGLVIGVSLLALDLPRGMLLQAVAPTGLNGLLVAHRFNLTLQPIASSIVWTTSLVTLGAVVVSILG
ncbi:MAG: AEC family transporter [Patulibacter sp.]